MNVGAPAVVPCGGFRQLANNVRRVARPADLKGIKIRVTKSPTAYELIKGWGGIAVSVRLGAALPGHAGGRGERLLTFPTAGRFTSS